MLSKLEDIQQLSGIAQNDIFALVSGSGVYVTEIPKLCSNIVNVIDRFLDPAASIDLSEPSIQDFLKHTLPALTEAFLRRVTLREHEDDVAKLLVAVSRLLAKPASHDIIELCELRNLLLVGIMPAPLKFIDPKQFTSNQYIGNHFSNDGFFGEFGAPSVAYLGSKMLTFWPDEWQKALGGNKAVGHFVEWYHKGQVSDRKDSDKKDSGNTVPTAGWLAGRVVSFKRETLEHTIQLEPISASMAEGDANSTEHVKAAVGDSSEISAAAPTFHTVNLAKVKHHWIDSEFRNRIAMNPMVAPGTAPVGDTLLEFAVTDVGQFIRIWWSRYDKYYYGRVVRYDPVTRAHTVSYEDGDSRAYDMMTKDYMVIAPPAEVLLAASESDLTDKESAKIVADWHRTQETSQESTRKPKNVQDGEAEPFRFMYIHRPVAATALTWSVFHLAVIDEYFKEGGADALFQSLTDASQAPPVSRIILLHLHLIYNLRTFLGPERFNDLAWDLKEAIPFALLRYEDAQIKELSSKTLNDLLNALREMLQLVVGGSQYTANHSIRESIDELRLTIASMLLVCSQLQKRYLGLSMIKDTLDTLLPRLDNYVTKRYNAIGVARAVRAQPSRPGSAVASTASRINLPYMDKWLVDNGVLEILFGESLHQDLVAKSDVLLLYMGSRKVLTERHIDLIWNASLGVHEAVVRVLHQLLVLIVPVLGTSLRNYLFSLMAALPCKDYTEQILQLIKAYTEQALVASKDDNSENKTSSTAAPEANPIGGAGALSRKGQVLNVPQRQWMGFGVLWQFVQDPTASSGVESTASGKAQAQDSVDEGLVDLAVQLLVELLQEEFKDERELVMQRCLDNIQAGRSVPVSLQILRRTLALYPQAPKTWFVLGRPGVSKATTVAHQIEKLIKNSQLLEILFRDLDAYHRSILASEKTEASSSSAVGMKQSRSLLGIDKIVPKMMMRGAAASSAAPAVSQVSSNQGQGSKSAHATGRVSQLKGVSERLDFLRFIISWSSVKLSEQQTMILWNAFGEGATTGETLEKLVLWFNVLVNKESKSLAALLSSIAQESDPTDPDQRSKLAFLAPQLLSLIQQQGYGYPGAASNSALALLAAGSEDEETNNNAGAAGSAAESHSTFDDGVLIKLFEENIMKWAFRIEKVDNLSRLPVANLCFKLFLHTNISNKALKVEPDGSWSRIGPLSGLPLLWRIALDSTDLMVAHAAIALLIELHHKTTVVQKPLKPGDLGYKANLLQLCFKHLYLALNSLQLEDGASPAPAQSVTDNTAAVVPRRPASAAPGAPNSPIQAGSLGESSTAADEWFHDQDSLMKPTVIAARIERLIITLKLSIHRHYMAPTVLYTIKVLVGREEAPVFTVVLKATDQIGHLRKKIAEHFKESVETIQILKTAKTSTLMGMGAPTQDLLDKDDLTLVQAKLAVQDFVTARKSDSSGGEIGQAPGSMQQPKPRATDVKDLFSPQDLTVNLLKPLNPLQWIDACAPGATDSEKSSSGSGSGAEVGSYELFVLPPFPLVSVIEAKLTQQERTNPTSLPEEPTVVVSTKGPVVATRESPTAFASAPSAASERCNRVLEQLAPLFRASPHHIDQLLEILDGYLSTEGVESRGSSGTDLSAAVWDILLSLPTHAQLSQQLKNMVTETNSAILSRLLSPSCPYRLLYSLRIIDTFLSLGSASNAFPKGSAGSQATAASVAVLDWTVKFFHIGGAEYILQLLDTFLAKECQREVRNPKAAKSAARGSLEGMPRKDLNVMIVSILSRVLYHLLMLDPHFRGWQSSSANEIQSRLYATFEDPSVGTMSEIVPAGVILSNVDVPGLCAHIMKCSLQATELYKVQLITSSALRALCENSFLLMFGLLSSVSDGYEVLSSSEHFRPWLSALCVRCSSKSVRQAACRRLFEVSANVFNKCADPTVSQEDKRGRLRFYDYIHEEIVAAISSDSTAVTTRAQAHAQAQAKIKHGEEVYTLVAAIEALRNSSYLIFPQLSSKRVMRSSSGKLPDNSPRSGVASPTETLRSSMPEANTSDDDPAGTAALVRLFIVKLMSHTSNESFHSAEPDGTLVGILRVLLIFANSSDLQRVAMGEMRVDLEDGTAARLIPYIYSNCLFPTLAPSGASVGDISPTANSNYVEFLGAVEAGCQTQESRKLAYALLYRLCESTPSNLSQLVEAVGGEILSTTAAAPKSTAKTEMSEFDPSAAMKRIPTWNYDPDTLLKEPDAYVGLCNQGGTCYMNSFIQQLFHIPAFKAGLLRINASKGKSSSPDEALDANAQLLFQLQVMFGFMNFSQKRYYDTLPFCRAFIDYDGEPISMSEQKDINEFAGMLFDKLEANKEAAALLASTIQGKIVWRTRSIETPYKSEREENFYMLTAEVKDKATLEDSLELFTADELFSGDNKIEDADTGKKVDALRGCAIRSLPSTLIIHLKRFEFDLETMNRKKVNDLIAFPTDLNMFPYTEEGLQAKEDKLRASGSSPVPVAESNSEDIADAEEEARPSGASTTSNAPRRPEGYYQYALKGIVAHVGAIDRGHYYSFIKNPEAGTPGSGVWQEFNDRSVLPFSPEAIPLECFGGKDEYVNSNGVSVSRARENSAYLLVYERIGDSGEEPFESSRQRLHSESMDDTIVSGIRGVRSGSIDETQPRRGVSKKVMRAVSTENAEFQRDRFLFHPLHFAFIWQLQHMQAVVDLLQTAKGKIPSSDEHDPNKKFIYDTADPSDVTLTLTVPSHAEDRGDADSAGSALSHLVLDGMRFIVEVLVRARAKSCVQLFLERLEEIVVQDISGAAARSLIEFLVGDEPGSPTPLSADSSKGTNSTPDFAEVNSTQASAKPRMQMDLEHIERVCHPWLAQMLIFCPHPATTRLFMRFLLACVKVIRVAQQAPTFSAAEVPGSITVVNTGEGGAEVVLNIPSCVAALVDKVLLIVEKPQLDYLGCKENFEIRTYFLLQFSGLGSEEKALLVHLGAIPRLSCAVMAVFPNVSRSSDLKLHLSIDLIAKLIRASRSKHFAGVTGSLSPTMDTSVNGATEALSVSPVEVPMYLKPIDLQAFLGRTFLEEAVVLHPAAASAAASHMYHLIRAEDAASMLDFLAERLCDQLGVNTSGAMPAYRYFLRVLSDLLLGVALKDILVHVGALMKVITKAQLLANRQAGLDCEFVFAALRMLHTLGSASAEGHSTVMQLRDLWRNIAPKLAAAKRTAVYSAEGVLQNAPGQSTKSNGNGNGSGNGNKATASAAAFMMN